MGSSLMSRLNGRLLFSFYSSALSVADVDSGFVENFTIRRLKKKNKKNVFYPVPRVRFELKEGQPRQKRSTVFVFLWRNLTLIDASLRSFDLRPDAIALIIYE